MLTFDHPITNKAAVERALTLTTSNPVVGAWYWDGNEQLDFRPRDYWPATHGHLLQPPGRRRGRARRVRRARPGPDVHDRPSLIAVANTGTHNTRIYLDGKLKYSWPISTGKTVTPTPDGTYLTVDKNNPVRMIGGGKKGSPGYYNELVNYAVRFTFSGDYYHSAPWSVVSQGTTNVSHGCVNLSPADAKTFYQMAVPGDPITITSSAKAGSWDDGWTQWFLTWSQFWRAARPTRRSRPARTAAASSARVACPTTAPASPLGTSSGGNDPAAHDLRPRVDERLPSHLRLRVPGGGGLLGHVRGRGARRRRPGSRPGSVRGPAGRATAPRRGPGDVWPGAWHCRPGCRSRLRSASRWLPPLSPTGRCQRNSVTEQLSTR